MMVDSIVPWYHFPIRIVFLQSQSLQCVNFLCTIFQKFRLLVWHMKTIIIILLSRNSLNDNQLIANESSDVITIM